MAGTRYTQEFTLKLNRQIGRSGQSVCHQRGSVVSIFPLVYAEISTGRAGHVTGKQSTGNRVTEQPDIRSLLRGSVSAKVSLFSVYW